MFRQQFQREQNMNWKIFKSKNMQNFKVMLIGLLLFSSTYAIESSNKNKGDFLVGNFNNRIYLGEYASYFDDNIRLMQIGYDYILQLIQITPNYNLFDFGLGLNGLLAFDNRGGVKNDRLINARITPGFELNWSLRMYVLPIPKIKSRIYMEGLGMSLVAYSREYPDNGTKVNIGSHVGIGMEFPIDNYKIYTTLRLFHSSNGRGYSNNPALNAIGIIIGNQFK